MKLDDSRLCDAEEFGRMQSHSPDALRETLRDGEPRERVWAAWSLGLKLERGAADDILEALSAEAHPGVRRHFLVMLAGWSKVDPIAHAARFDDDEYVRATAVRYAGILSDSVPALAGVVASAMSDPAPRVRAAAVSHAPEPDAGTELAHRLDAALDDEDPRVRSAAVARLLARGDSLTDDRFHRAWLDAPEHRLGDRILDAWTEAMTTETIAQTFEKRGGLPSLYSRLRESEQFGHLLDAVRDVLDRRERPKRSGELQRFVGDRS